MFLKETPEERAKLKEAIKKLTENIENTFIRLKNAEKFPEDMVEDVKSIYKPWEAFRNTRDSELIPLIEAGKIDEAKKIAFGVQAERYNKFRALAIEFTDKELKEMIENKTSFESIAGLSKKLLIALFFKRYDKSDCCCCRRARCCKRRGNP